MAEKVLIVGSGSGLSVSLARLFSNKKMKVVLAARNIQKLQNLSKETKAETITCYASDVKSVRDLFKSTDKLIGIPNIVIYNPSYRIKGGDLTLGS